MGTSLPAAVKAALWSLDVDRIDLDEHRELILKELVYFDDLDQEPLRYIKEHALPFDEVKKFLRAKASKAY